MLCRLIKAKRLNGSSQSGMTLACQHRNVVNRSYTATGCGYPPAAYDSGCGGGGIGGMRAVRGCTSGMPAAVKLLSVVLFTASVGLLLSSLCVLPAAPLALLLGCCCTGTACMQQEQEVSRRMWQFHHASDINN